ncbi:hypothetical protein NJ7G_1605 [Natrinema sp. J7-2]|nr:hypothetical protein NJ7G_1605 [Natrinema sp. J7-2]
MDARRGETLKSLSARSPVPAASTGNGRADVGARALQSPASDDIRALAVGTLGHPAQFRDLDPPPLVVPTGRFEAAVSTP